jgi:type I restriction-modification system DNA methylase subunit
MNKYQKQFVGLIKCNHTKHHHLIFLDFLDLARISLANQIYRSPELESEYLNIIKAYPKEMAINFGKMLGLVVLGLENDPTDFLGDIYTQMSLEEELGQFFTPYDIAFLLAQTVFSDENITKNGHLNFYEPASGAGITILALRNLLHSKGYGVNHLFVRAIDIDRACFNMTYIQLSLTGVAAQVILGNSLSNNEQDWKSIYTPCYFLSKFQKLHHPANSLQATP